MRFALYHGPYTKASLSTGITLDELLVLAKDGELVARAENSGSEGCYVEVARWNPNPETGPAQWQRYAFEKVFGGEIERLDPKKYGLFPGELDADATAEVLAGMINMAGWKHHSLIHTLPTWGPHDDPKKL